MSNLDELYKESGIKEIQSAGLSRKKSRIIMIFFYIAVYSIIVYWVRRKGLFGEGSQPYYFLVIIAIFLYFAIKKIKDIGNLIYRILKTGDIK